VAKKKAKKKKCKKKKAKKIDLKKLVSRWAEIDKVIDKNHSRLGRHGARRIYMDDEMSRRILLFHDEHGEVAYDASTPQKTLSAFLDHVTTLFGGSKPEWYSAKARVKEIEKQIQEDKDSLDFDENTPVPVALKFTAQKKLDEHEAYQKMMKEELHNHKLLAEAIRLKDGEKAFLACDRRQDHEYERWEFEYFVEVPKNHNHIARMHGVEERKQIELFRKKYSKNR